MKSIKQKHISISGRLGLPLLCLCYVAWSLRTTPAFCQPNPRDPVGAEELFRLGLAALKVEDWHTACEKFRKSMDLDPSVSTQFKLAKCSEHEGRLATAWYEYELARKMNREAPVSERRRAELEEAIRVALVALKPRVPMLSIHVVPSPTEMEVLRNGVPVARSALGELLPIDPGDHELLVRARGFEDSRQRIVVAEGRTVEAEIKLVAKANLATPQPSPSQVPAPLVPTTPSPVGQSQSSSQTPAKPFAPGSNEPKGSLWSRWSQRETGLTLVGTGAVVLAVAGYYGIRTLYFVGKMDEYKNADETYRGAVREPHEKALTAQTISLVLAGSGASLAGIGMGLYLLAQPPKSAVSPARSANFQVRITPTGVLAQGVW